MPIHRKADNMPEVEARDEKGPLYHPVKAKGVITPKLTATQGNLGSDFATNRNLALFEPESMPKTARGQHCLLYTSPSPRD